MRPLEDLNGCEAGQLVWDVLIMVDRSQSFAAANPSQVKSAPTPVGEPNVRAEAEKENIDTPETVQPTGVSQKTW